MKWVTARRRPRRATIWLALSLLAVVVPPASAAVEQPVQPTSGPGSSDYPSDDVDVIAGGTGDDAWFLFLPKRPQPASAPLVVITHGYSEYAGNGMNGAIARHTARMGNVVIYPRWQTGLAAPCPGPFAIEPCIRSEVNGIRGALGYLEAHPELPQAQLDRTSYFGFSFGGVVTVDMLTRWKELRLPEPRAVFLDDPHDGGLTGNDEPAVYPDLSGIPSSTKLICHSSAEGVTGEEPESAGSSCNAFYNRLGHIPAANKSLTMTQRDEHGQPALSTKHGVCAGPWDPTSDAKYELAVNAYDWGYCWRAFDALRACALSDTQCEYALGDTPQNRYVGTWSDGTPIAGVKVQAQAPIRPDADPVREAAPAGQPERDAPPTGRVKAITRRGATVRGTASDDRGVAQVEVAVVQRSGRRCRQMGPTGRFTRLRRCSAPTSFLAATGARTLTLKLPRRLPAARYAVVVRATDTAGHQTTTPARTLRVR